MDDLVGLYL